MYFIGLQIHWLLINRINIISLMKSFILTVLSLAHVTLAVYNRYVQGDIYV